MNAVLLDPGSGHNPEKVDSTNDFIKNLPPGSWVTAETQTDGRGRKSRTWTGFGGEKIFFSGKTGFASGTIPLTLLSPVTALAVYHSVYETFPEIRPGDILLKWPNDLYYNNKKFSGILIEPELKENRINVITGIGLNLASAAVPDDLKEIACALFPEPTGKKNDLTAKLIHNLNLYSSRLLSKDSIPGLVKEINAISLLNGKTIEFDYRDKKNSGEVIEINHNGFLVIATDNGLIELTDSTENMRTL